MKDYELTVIFHPDLEMNLDPAVEKVKKTIKSHGGTITKEENEGKKRLAYPISGQTHAVFYYLDISLPSDAPAKISSSLNINDEVLRFLLVRTDERKAKLAAKRSASNNQEEETNQEKEEE